MLDILIIEPNPQLVTPYSLLTGVYKQTLSLSRVDSLHDGEFYFLDHKPDLLMISASFAAHDVLEFLTFTRRHMELSIVPIIWVVDLHQPLSQVLGTAWGGQVAVLSSEAQVTELRSTLYHLLTEEVVEGQHPEVAETIPDDESVTKPAATPDA